jgi:hypothetical protein
MSRPIGKRQRAAQSRKVDRERRRDERRTAKLGGRMNKKQEAEMMRQEAEKLLRQGVLRAAQVVAEAGGVVLFDRAGRPFAMYPPRLPQQIEDRGAPGRMREILGGRVGEGG